MTVKFPKIICFIIIIIMFLLLLNSFIVVIIIISLYMTQVSRISLDEA